MSQAPVSPAVEMLLEDMPKAELHLHLDGSMRVETALELARSRGIDAPRTPEDMAAALIAPMPCVDQAELLRAFDLPIALMQDAEALERVTYELVETKAAEKVRYVEIRWGPLLHLTRGLSIADGIAAVCRGARRGAAETGVEVALISTDRCGSRLRSSWPAHAGSTRRGHPKRWPRHSSRRCTASTRPNCCGLSTCRSR